MDVGRSSEFRDIVAGVAAADLGWGGGALIPWRSKAGYQAAGDLALVAKQAAVCFAGAIEAGPREPLCEGVA